MPHVHFDHRVTGTAEDVWRTAGLPQLSTVTVPAARLVVLAAHPDDETLGAGGLLAAAARAGADITVVVATDGEASHPASPTHTPTQLADIRRREVQAAVTRLAPGAVVQHLGLPDGRLGGCSERLDAALTALAGTTSTLLVTPWTADGHPDHEACGRAAARLAQRHELVELWQYPIWFWHWATPGELPASLARLELSDSDRSAKGEALAEHVSQHHALSDQAGDEAILPASMLTHFERSFECFVVEPAASKAAYFEDLYRHAADPWGLGTRFYEHRKRDLALASLPRRRFRRAFEPGCATGLLTEQLLERADHVVAWDVVDAALQQTARRQEQVFPRLQLARGHIPAEWPEGAFDLVVLSEVGYYCSDLTLLVQRVLSCLAEDGVLLACHWTRPAPDHPHTADEVHAAFDDVLCRTVHHLEADFRLDVWTRDGHSVAAAEGIV